MKEEVCSEDALAPGQMRTAMLGRIPIVVVRTPSGELFALSDKCLHQGASLSEGRLGETMAPADDVGVYIPTRDGEILRCPWHGYEYDVRTGCLLAGDGRRTRTFRVVVEGGTILVST